MTIRKEFMTAAIFMNDSKTLMDEVYGNSNLNNDDTQRIRFL